MQGKPNHFWSLLLSQLSFKLIIILFTTSHLLGQELKFGKTIYPLIKKQDFTAAKPLLHQLLERHPAHAKANFWLAKIYEDEGFTFLSQQHLQKAVHHYLRCKSNFTKDQLNILNQHHYAELKQFKSEDRFESFRSYLSTRANELRFAVNEMSANTITRTFQNMSDVQEQLQIQLPDELSALSVTNFELSYDLVNFQGRTKIEGSVVIDVQSIPDLTSVYWKATYKDNQLITTDSLHIRSIKRVKKQLENVNIEGIEELLQVPIYPFVSNLFDYYDGYIHYVLIDTNVYLDGPFYFELQSNEQQPIYGNLSSQSGFVDIINHQWDEYDEVGFRLHVLDGAIKNVDYEKINFREMYYTSSSYEGEMTKIAEALRSNDEQIIRKETLISSAIGNYQLIHSPNETSLSYPRLKTLHFTDSTSRTFTVLTNQLEPEIKAILMERLPLKDWLELEMERRQFDTNILPRKEFNRIKWINWE